MVKGNWERRAELSLLRRTEAKKMKEERKTKPAGIESICSKLLQDIDRFNTIYAYVDSGLKVCRAYLRSDCLLKKCKLLHDVSISHLKNSQYNALLTDFDGKLVTQETAVSEPLELRTLKTVKEFQSIRFIALDNAIIYDSENCDIWKKFHDESFVSVTNPNTNSNPAAVAVAPVDASSILSTSVKRPSQGTRMHTIAEEESNANMEEVNGKGDEVYEEIQKYSGYADNDGTIDLSIGNLVVTNIVNDMNQKECWLYKVITCKNNFLGLYLLPYLDLSDIHRLLLLSKFCKARCYKDFRFLQIRGERLKVLACHEANARKLEKKKKQKNAYIKISDKKDAFARGTPGR